jgi:alpha-2-macroglobulin
MRTTTRFQILILLLMLPISLRMAQVQSQQNEIIAPQVLAVQPFPGEEMPLDSPVTIIFNQDMNQATIESAWSITPAIEGLFHWDDSRTLSFMPADGWMRETTYALTIGKTATAMNGQSLTDTYQATLRTVGRLSVNSVIPAENTEGVATDATFTIAFNRPVVPLGATADLATLPNPLTISPAVDGHGEWLNTSIYQFTPHEDLLGGATYTVIVNAGLVAVSGASLEEDYLWSFQTLAPEILYTYPVEGDRVPLDNAVNISFSQPMNQVATESAFKLLQNGDPVAGQFSWSNDGKQLTFVPDTRLSIATTFQVIIDADLATGLGGATLRQGRNFTFQSMPLPYVEYTSPNNGESDVSPRYQQASINFGTPMNTETFTDKVIISPEPAEVTPLVYGNQNLNLEFVFEPNTTYTLTLLAGAEDIYGNPTPTDYTFSFSVSEVRSQVYLPDAGHFIVTGAYRENTAISVNVAGTPTVNFTLYDIPIAQTSQTFQYLYDDTIETIMQNSEQIREWSQALGAENTYTSERMNLASEQGGALSPGMYMVVGRYNPDSLLERLANGSSNERVMPIALAVANTNITVKRMEDEVLIWLTDMESGEPLVEQPVNVYATSSDEVLASGFTDSEGVLRLPISQSNFIMVISESADRYGVWHSDWAPSSPKENLYLYTDRPLYRPNETVYFRGIYREQDDFNYHISNLKSVDVLISDYQNQTLLETTLDLTELGSFNGEILLPDTTAIGTLYIQIMKNGYHLGSLSAQVAEFRVPEFIVSVSAEEDEIIAGESIQAVINGKFFSGGAVSDADVTWSANGVQTTFQYTGAGRYNFSDNNGCGGYYDFYCGYYPRSIASASGLTDSNGNLIVEVDNTTPDGAYPETVTIEATINDESGQYISGRTDVLVHPSEVYVGVRTTEYFGQENKPFTTEVITVSPQSDFIDGQAVNLTLIERRWEREEIEGQFGRYTWAQREIKVETVRVTSDDTGRASYDFTPPNAGIFVIQATTYDRQERLHQSSTQMWVTGTGRVWWGQPSNVIDLIADKDSYVAGENAQVLVPISLEGVSWVLVSLERDGVMSYDVVRVEGSTLVYDVPLTSEHEPGVYISVMVMHGIDEDNNVPTYRQGSLLLNVEPVSKRLNVTIAPSTANAQPGDTVTLDINVTDPQGNPIEAEFGLALVDAAILSLSEPNSADPETHYYGWTNNFTDTATMLSALVDGRLDDEFGEEQDRADNDDGIFMESETSGARSFAAGDTMALAAAPMAEGVGQAKEMRQGGFDNVTVRADFQQTPLWEAHVITDVNGQAQVSVVMPDNLTIWNLTARAVTGDTLVAETKLDIASTLPLLVRPSTPRFFVVGDEVSLAMVVNNNSDEMQTVDTMIQGTGYELLNGETLQQSMQIEPNSRVRFEWRVKILDVDSVDLTFIAIGNDGYQDASKPPLATGVDGTIPVYHYTAPDTTGTGGVLRDAGSRTEGISIPPYADTDQGTLTVQLDPSLAVTTLDSLDYLKNYPHQCIEQTVSRFLPNVITYRALKSLGVNDPLLEEQLFAAIDFGAEKLRAGQNSDGGWGWFAGMESNPIVTAYATFGLIEASDVGYDLEHEMINRAISFLRGQFINPTEDSDIWKLNRQAFYFYVLTRADDGRYAPSPAELEALFRVRLEMNHDAKAYLLMAYASLNGDYSNPINALTGDLVSSARLSATGAHWEENYRDWWNWGSNTRSTAVVLSALLQSVPDSELLPNAVRWLMVARRGDHWVTTQETTWAVMALTDWMTATNELNGNYDYTLVLNSDEQTAGQVTPDSVRTGQQLTFEVAELLQDEINRLTVIRSEGEGALYYTAHLKLRLDANEVEAIDRGVGITREYFMDDQETPVTEAQMGDILTVRLTMTLSDSIYFFVLEDPLPAGMEALDTSLLTTTQAVPGPQLRPTHNPYYYWRWWYWDHTEIRDESVNLYADYLPAGTYVYSYQVRATTPGIFQTMPSHGYAFYFPEVFGRSDGELFTIENLE